MTGSCAIPHGDRRESEIGFGFISHRALQKFQIPVYEVFD
jgi:hypothetical protein